MVYCVYSIIMYYYVYSYRPPNETNKKVFFDELNETLDKAVNKYDNDFIAEDLILTLINLRIQISISVILRITFLKIVL